ncbi:MAG: LamG domain-containing protein, partial [Prevotellaceae bacterium]|nr:LamG domain-containing protein [Prevotellaceae bacterium]
LTEAKVTFEGNKYEAIPASNLLIGLSFDEGAEATTQLTAAGKNLVATLETGPSEIFGANTGKPTFVDGKKGKAIHFTQGSHLEIAQYARADFEGKELSIAVWVKPDETRENNHIISYNSWHSWKFNLQSQNKPFFTVSTDGGAVDADDEGNGVPNGSWTHLVVALNLTAKTLDLYTNGLLVKHWTSEDKPNLQGTIAPNEGAWPLTIGTFYSFNGAVNGDWDGWANATPEEWNSYFVGAIDELKVYNTALTEGQVSGLYNSEN